MNLVFRALTPHSSVTHVFSTDPLTNPNALASDYRSYGLPMVSLGRCPKCGGLETCVSHRGLRWCPDEDCFTMAALIGENYWVRLPELTYPDNA